MLKIEFEKFQGTGNDFVMLNNLSGRYDNLTIDQIKFMCSRKFGIGSDGLIKINSKEGYDFEVEYFNADGSKSFCGNGARAAMSFAKKIGCIGQDARFWAIDGEHTASILKDQRIKLKMNDVAEIAVSGSVSILNTGSPHYIEFDTAGKEIVSFGRSIRYSDNFAQNGINVNLVNTHAKGIEVATYERGVEDETLSCGTGVTAAALAYMKRTEMKDGKVSVHTKGGDLEVEAEVFNEGFTNVYLIGPAAFVFSGEIIL